MGRQISGNRAGTARSISGTSVKSRYGPGSPVSRPFSRTWLPSDRAANTTTPTASALTRGRRHCQSTTTAQSTSSGRPKNEFSSVGFGDSSPGTDS